MSVTPIIYWAINGTELQLGNSSISGTYSGSFAGNTVFDFENIPWNNYLTTIISVDILSDISIGSGAYLFCQLINCETIKNINRLDTSNVTNMEGMFYGCGYNSSTFSLDISTFDTSKVINMNLMFYQCGTRSVDFTLDITNFDTSNVTNMSRMFYYCGYMSTNFALDLSSFDTSKVTDMSYMFYYCVSLNTIYVSNRFITNQVTLSDYMFTQCTSLVGAVPYDSSKTDVSMANYTIGYFTYKAIEPIFPEILDISSTAHQVSILEEVQSNTSGLMLGRKENKHTDILINLGDSEEDQELYDLIDELGWMDELDPGNNV